MSQSVPYICPIIFVVSLGGATLIYRRVAGRDFIERVVAAIIPVLFLAFILRLLVGITARPFSDWDTARLTPVFALGHGYRLYPTPETGPLVSFCYGPVSALFYLPIIYSPTPTFAVLAAATISVIIMLAPVLWLHVGRHAPGSTRWFDRMLAFLVFAGLVFLLPSLSYSLFSPAHDAVALGLGAFATALLDRGESNSGIVRPMVSACLAILAVWAKQTMIALLIALPLYILVTDGVRSCRRYVGFLAISGVAVSSLFVLAFDHEGLLLNVLEIPLHHVRDKTLTDALWYFQSEVPVVAILLTFGLIYDCSQRWAVRSASDRTTPVRPRWLAFVILGIVQLPAAFAGYTKLGGGENSFSLSLYYLAVGAVLLLADIAEWGTAGEEPNVHRRVAQAVLVSAGCVLLFAPVLPLKVHQKATYPDPLQAAFEFEKKYPGRAYFPWNTLSVIMASGKLYHAEDGIISLAMAGRDLTVDQFQKHLPPHATLLALPPNYPAYWTNRRIQRVLPEFRTPVVIEELPGWSVFERDAR